MTNESKIEKIINQYFPKETILHIEPLRGGISAQTTAVTLNEQTIIIRIVGSDTLAYNPQVAQQEFATLTLLEKVDIPAPKPLFLDQSHTITETPFLILNYLPGAPFYAPTNIPDFASQIAKQLANIHQTPLNDEIKKILPKQIDRMNRWFAPTNQRKRTELSSSIWDLFQTAYPFPNLNQTALLHGDFWPGNILWEEEQLTAVIDWEESELGDPLADLAITRLDLLFIIGEEGMNIFTESYKKENPISFTNLPYWDLHAAFRPGSDISLWASDWDKLGRPEITAQTMTADLQFFAANAFKEIHNGR